MKLQYTNEANTTIQATLDDGKTLGNYIGPVEIYVPTDPANAEYADIIKQGLAVTSYVPPVAAN